MEINQIYKAFLASSGICTDTRKIEKDCLFFALKGANFNGNHFAERSLEQGALMAIVDEDEYATENCILVKDVLQTLQDLAIFHRQQLSIPVIGITGSNGKTTTKELIFSVLNTYYKTIATAGNLNNHIGVPLSLLRITKEHEIAIIEMGANHQKEIAMLSAISQPDYGYISNFGKAHLEGFGGIEGVIKGKTELYDYLRMHGKPVLVNADDPLQVEHTKGMEIITFGTGEGLDYQFSKNENSSSLSTVSIVFENVVIQSNLSGSYNFSNLAAAVSFGLLFKVPIESIKSAIENYHPNNHRSQISKTEHNTLLLDAYNANPSSMEAAIHHFVNIEAPGKWIILGDMFELGDESEAEHERIAGLLKNRDVEKVILVGEHFFKTDNNFQKFRTTNEVSELLNSAIPKEKTILIKGSRGMKLEQIIPYL